jgi:medium-chain acyl-[acyl-carrier-protein] hydrolase
MEIPRIWTETFKIRSDEVGITRLLTPQALCRYMQEAAGTHASKLKVTGEMLEEQDLMWVLSRLRWQMQKTPAWHDQIKIETWPTQRTKGIRAHRDFRFYDEGGQQIGQASTIWLLLSRKSRRPLRIPDFLNDYQSPGLVDDLLGCTFLMLPSRKPSGKEFEVRLSDLDANQHVNNVCYVEWALDALPIDLIRSNRVGDLEISFLGEGQFGDTVEARSQPDSDAVPIIYSHEIVNKANNRTLALMKTFWVHI